MPDLTQKMLRGIGDKEPTALKVSDPGFMVYSVSWPHLPSACLYPKGGLGSSGM